MQTDAPAAALGWPDRDRAARFAAWFDALPGRADFDAATLGIASADASHRRYLRVQRREGASAIIMDAPPALEDVRPFVHVAALARDAGLHVPRVLAAAPDEGFLLLDDLGTAPYLQALQAASPAEADRLMRDALAALVRWQAGIAAQALPPYDEALLRRELALFPTWCVAGRFGVSWSPTQQEAWAQISDRLVASALAQPVVAVHRDWMPRNLMVCEPNPGILDFQDAVAGPITYDLASLLRDAFLSWDEERELDWAARYWGLARRAGLPVDDDFGAFWRALEWMGLQRHLKILGIFCRLALRDGKPRYAEDLPRFFAYATKTARRYRELAPLLGLLEPLSGLRPQVAYSLR